MKRRCALAGLLATAALLLVTQRAAAVDDGITDYVTIPAGSYLIDTGSLSPTVANAMQPYGLVFDLVRNQKVPVLWAINPAKAKDGVDFTNPNTGKSYRAGPFIVSAISVSPAVVAVINNWRAKGVIVDGPTTGPIAGVPVYDSITGIANVVSDLQNGKIAEAFMTRAGIPSTAYRRDTPTSLNTCDDLFIMPHADPTWSSHQNLLPFVQSRGYLWSGCHAVSVLENIDNPSTPTNNPDLNFLSTRGLVPFGSHGDGSPPYTSILPGDPVMQFIGTTDAAQQGGSEQIYLPKPAGAWRAGARVLVSDTTMPADIPSKSNGPAAAIVYGRAFDVGTYGRIMYEGGHDVGGTAPANIAAQRAFLNFWLLALIDRSPDVAIAGGGITAVQEGGSLSLSSSVTHPFPIVSYQWSSSGGGTFSNPSSPTTSFTPPEVPADTPLVIRVTVSDGCNRTAFDTYQVTVQNLPKADLAIDKTGPTAPVAIGTNFAYTLAVSNLGTESAANVVVDDVLPAGLGFVSATGTGWTCSYDVGSRRVRCTRAALALTGGTPSGITVNVTAPATPGSLTNTATVASDTPDLVPGNNTDLVGTTFLQGTDVSIVKTASASTVYAGGRFSYTLTVANPGPLAATSLSIYDTLPASLAYVSATGSGWDCGYASTTRLVTCFRASFAAGANAPVTLTVIPSGSAGTVIPNTARVASPDFNDSNTGNNSSSVNVTLAATADLSLAKTGSTTGGGGSSQVDTYVVTLTNNGPGTATGIVVTDVMSGPGVVKYNQNAWACTLTPSTGSLSPASPWTIAQVQAGGTWSIASLASGASATLTLACAGDNNDGVMNRVSVTSASYDPTAANDSAAVYVADGSVTTTDIQVLKSSSPASVTTGGTITYRITLNNLSTQDANDPHTVTDTLPAGTTYVGFTNVGGGTWSCTHSAGVVTCTTTSDLKKLTGSPNTLFFDITVTAPSTPGTITNTASSFYDWGNRQYDPPANNTATATTSVIAASADVSVTKSASNATPPLGDNVTFSITARNNSGSVTATGLRVQDLLPAGLEYVSASSSQGSFDPYDPTTGLWYIGSLAPSAQATLSIVARAAGAQQTTNQACLYFMNQTDTNAANDCGAAVVTPQSANLGLTKTASTATPNLGSNVTFTVTLNNAGPSAAASITVVDALLEGLEYVSHSTTTGTFDSTIGQWTVPGSLASGASATLTLVAKVTTAATPITNTASITASSLPDTDPSNNSASVVVTGQAVDVGVTKGVDVPVPLALNTPVTFTVTAKNNGPSDATGVAVTDLLPAGLGYQSHTASQGAYVPGSGVWTVGALASGATATLTLVATNTTFGALLNTATRTASDQPDADSSNDTASASVLSGGAADLSLTKVADTPTTFQGSTVSFTLQLDNFGPNPASGVVIRDVLPAGLGYVSSVASQGSYDPATRLWTVGNLAVDQRVTLVMTVSAVSVGTFANTAEVAALDQADPDATNSTSTVVVEIDPAADLSVTKTGPGSATLGTAVGYTLVARNAGPSNVSGAVLTDTVPAEVVAVSWTCVATGSADCDTLTAGTGASGSGNAISLGNVSITAGAGNFLTVTVAGTAGATGTVTNTVIFATPANGSVFDPSVTNNSASVVTVISNRVVQGRVFADTGTGGGVANDGTRNGSEPGIADVTLRLTDCAAAVYSTTRTNGDGDYLLAIPDGVVAGATVCVVESNRAGYTSTGGGAGNTGGSYDRAGDRVQWVMGSTGVYSGVDFGDVPENRLLTDGALTAQPGSTVTFTHVFVAGSGGQVTFTTLGASSPDVLGWSEVLFRDADCSGSLTAPPDAALAGPLTVVAGERVCLLVQQFVPAGLPSGATRSLTVQAFFVYTGAGPALTATYTRQDVTVTSAGALLLVKDVRNVTKNGAWARSNVAGPQDVLEYRITYTNTGSTSISTLVVSDMTPAFTTFLAAACGAPLPPSLTACSVTAPGVGASGPIQWLFSGVLAPSGAGVVTYLVKVD